MRQEQNAERVSNYLGIDDPDVPIYRFYPLWYFQQALRLKQLVLVSPSLWPDPYEQLAWRCKITLRNQQPIRHEMSEPYLLPARAQCWSATAESETLLKAYSRVVKHPLSSRNQLPGEEGVMVGSTPRKLLESLQAWATPSRKNSCFIGRVRYSDRDEIGRHLTRFFHELQPKKLVSERQMAELLLLKRNAFEHENEIRLIYVGTHDDGPPDCICCQIDPNQIFDGVMFDPKLHGAERMEREAYARILGYEGNFVTSKFYSPVVFLQIVVD